jgi:hypothetical protein
MTTFRKKPVVIEATQFWNDRPFPEGVCDCGEDPMHYGTPHIHTLEGIHDVTESDWIITGVAGERHPCKVAIFEATYEEV